MNLYKVSVVRTVEGYLLLYAKNRNEAEASVENLEAGDAEICVQNDKLEVDMRKPLQLGSSVLDFDIWLPHALDMIDRVLREYDAPRIRRNERALMATLWSMACRDLLHGLTTPTQLELFTFHVRTWLQDHGKTDLL